MGEFARSFNNADTLLVSDIYAASEEPIEGVTAEALTEAIARYGHKDAHYIGGIENAAQLIRERVQPGDMVITLGAGTVNQSGRSSFGIAARQGRSADGVKVCTLCFVLGSAAKGNGSRTKNQEPRTKN